MADCTPLVRLIEILEPLTPEERRRNINAALAYFGDVAPEAKAKTTTEASDYEDAGHFPPDVLARMRQNGISPDDAIHVFEFNQGEPFRILAVPGKGKKAQTLAMYHLVGLGTYLETGKREFTDAVARQYCKDYGCYDQANHATYLSDKNPAVTEDKNSGWLLTVPGIKIAAAMVKEVAGAARQ